MALEDEERSEEESEEEEAPSKKGSKTLLIIIIATVILLGGGGGAYFFLFRGADEADTTETVTDEGETKVDEGEKTDKVEEGAPDTTTKVKEGSIFPLEHFIVNVADIDAEDGTRYLKIEIKLELENPEMEPEVENRVHKIRDSIVTILTNKSVDEISSTNGKMRLKEEIRARINSFLTLGKITEVYFTDFIIQ
jgi:flagellar FliL protein